VGLCMHELAGSALRPCIPSPEGALKEPRRAEVGAVW